MVIETLRYSSDIPVSQNLALVRNHVNPLAHLSKRHQTQRLHTHFKPLLSPPCFTKEIIALKRQDVEGLGDHNIDTAKLWNLKHQGTIQTLLPCYLFGNSCLHLVSLFKCNRLSVSFKYDKTSGQSLTVSFVTAVSPTHFASISGAPAWGRAVFCCFAAPHAASQRAPRGYHLYRPALVLLRFILDLDLMPGRGGPKRSPPQQRAA